MRRFEVQLFGMLQPVADRQLSPVGNAPPASSWRLLALEGKNALLFLDNPDTRSLGGSAGKRLAGLALDWRQQAFHPPEDKQIQANQQSGPARLPGPASWANPFLTPLRPVNPDRDEAGLYLDRFDIERQQSAPQLSRTVEACLQTSLIGGGASPGGALEATLRLSLGLATLDLNKKEDRSQARSRNAGTDGQVPALRAAVRQRFGFQVDEGPVEFPLAGCAGGPAGRLARSGGCRSLAVAGRGLSLADRLLQRAFPGRLLSPAGDSAAGPGGSGLPAGPGSQWRPAHGSLWPGPAVPGTWLSRPDPQACQGTGAPESIPGEGEPIHPGQAGGNRQTAGATGQTGKRGQGTQLPAKGWWSKHRPP